VDGAATDFPAQTFGYGPAQLRVTDDDPDDFPANDMGCNTATGGFDFGEFGHSGRITSGGLVAAVTGRTFFPGGCSYSFSEPDSGRLNRSFARPPPR